MWNGGYNGVGRNTEVNRMGILKGEIIEVMECWPLELKISSPEGFCHVMLCDDVVILRSGEKVDPGALRPGMSVHIRKQGTGGDREPMIAQTVEIIN